MKLLYTVILCLAFLSASGQIKYQIDLELDNCLETNSGLQEKNNCYLMAIETWDQELNKYYNLYKAKLSKEAKKDLIEAQRAWLTYRDNEFKNIESHFFKSYNGSMPGLSAYGSKLQLVRDRAITIKSRYNEIAIE